MPDQVPSADPAVAAPFFGRPVLTMTLVSKLLRRVDVDIVVGAVTRGIRDDPVRAREPAKVRVVDATVHVDQPRAVQVPVPREFPRHPPPVLPEPRPRSSVDVSCAVQSAVRRTGRGRARPARCPTRLPPPPPTTGGPGCSATIKMRTRLILIDALHPVQVLERLLHRRLAVVVRGRRRSS